jgi:hypothetical protein
LNMREIYWRLFHSHKRSVGSEMAAQAGQISQPPNIID